MVYNGCIRFNSNIFLCTILFFFALGYSNCQLNAKEPIQAKMEKHLQAIERLTKKNDLEGLVFRMILIKRDVDEYHKKTYDYKVNSIYSYIEEVVTELHKSNPDIQISKKDIVSYKMYVRTLMNRLPIDFF